MDEKQLNELKQKYENLKNQNNETIEPVISPEKIKNVVKKAKEIEQLNKEEEKKINEPTSTHYEKFNISKDKMFEEYFTIKTEEQTVSVALPSRGIGYEHEELKKGSILLAPLTGLDEEKLIAIKNSNDLMGSFYNFVNSKIKTSGVTINDILANDFMSLVLYLQIISNPETREDRLINTDAYCPNCLTQNFFDELDIADLEISENHNTEFPIEIELDNYIILMKYLTIGDVRTIEKAVEYDKNNKILKQYGIDTTKIRELQFRTTKIIDKNTGQPLSPTKWFEFYLNLSRKDKKKINSKISETDNFGIPFYTAKCTNCGRVVRFQVNAKYITLFFK